MTSLGRLQRCGMRMRIFAACRFTRAVSHRSIVTMSGVKQVSSNKCWGGFSKRYQHASKALGCDMKFTIYFPPAAADGKVPMLYWLSGLTCDDTNFTQKAGAQRKASELGIALVATDTSPRGLDVQGAGDNWQVGYGAGYYLNATTDKYKNWQMYDYITKEIPELLAASFDNLDTSNASIFGHSMGGHGALVLGLRNPQQYKSISAFAPISNPSATPFCQKALKEYLDDQQDLWKQYDATELAKSYNGPERPTILIEQGTADEFLKENLFPERFEAAAKQNPKLDVQLRWRDGYDHSYYFMNSFIAEHIEHHAKFLKQ